MAEFSVGWFTQHANRWAALLAPLAGKPDLRFLEIGAFEGMATHWLLSHILTDPTSSITVIDTFDGSPEHTGMNIDVSGLRQRFEANIAPWRERVDLLPHRSDYALRTLYPCPVYDFAYLDGSHDAADVLSDAVLVWPLVKRGGLMVFDDYSWQYGLPDGRTLAPRAAIDAFLAVYAEQIDDVDMGYQVTVRKR